MGWLLLGCVVFFVLFVLIGAYLLSVLPIMRKVQIEMGRTTSRPVRFLKSIMMLCTVAVVLGAAYGGGGIMIRWLDHANYRFEDIHCEIAGNTVRESLVIFNGGSTPVIFQPNDIDIVLVRLAEGEEMTFLASKIAAGTGGESLPAYVLAPGSRIWLTVESRDPARVAQFQKKIHDLLGGHQCTARVIERETNWPFERHPQPVSAERGSLVLPTR
jgi:hypothetical protein